MKWQKHYVEEFPKIRDGRLALIPKEVLAERKLAGGCQYCGIDIPRNPPVSWCTKCGSSMVEEAQIRAKLKVKIDSGYVELP